MNRYFINTTVVLATTFALAACGGTAPTPTPLPPIAAADFLASTSAAMDGVTSYAFSINETHFGGTHEAGVSRLDGHWASPDRLQYDFVVTTDEGTWEGTEYRIGSSGQGHVHSGPVTGRGPLGFRATGLMNLTNTLVLGDAVVGEVQLPDGRQAYSITSKHSRAVSSDYGTGLATTIFSETMLIDPSTRRLL
ncbi:MAG: hypothetical protein O2826_04935 [Chloroflexi bacterium]|nr:hypothetical protein [Chloroflexota bacterium]MDA1173849.1 hypothetical protein [Chloroflexota bacterium]